MLCFLGEASYRSLNQPDQDSSRAIVVAQQGARSPTAAKTTGERPQRGKRDVCGEPEQEEHSMGLFVESGFKLPFEMIRGILRYRPGWEGG